MFEFEEINEDPIKIKVIGVGGGGNNAINTMKARGIRGVQFIAANTDVQSLSNSSADIQLQLGMKLTKGLGAGAEPKIGRDSALEDKERIAELIDGSDMVFVTAGMGGGTGTGAAPIIANIARELGILTVAVVTKPFSFEGKKRRRLAEEGLKNLKESVDTLIVIPNQRLLSITDEKTSFRDSFLMADNILLNAVQSICDIITYEGLINVDFADVKTVMNGKGLALMGTGLSSGEKRVLDATQKAISSPLLEDISIEGATAILLNIMGGSDIGLHEVHEAASLVEEAAHEEAQIILGYVVNEEMGGEVKVTVIATGFDTATPVAQTVKPTLEKSLSPILATRDNRLENAYELNEPRQPQTLHQLPLWQANGLPSVKWPAQTNRIKGPEDQDFDIPAFLRQRVD